MDISNFEKLPEDKKQTILSACILCFGTSGYEKTSIAEIAKAAGISKASVFSYFGTKQDLFMYIVQYTWGELEEVFAEGSWDYFQSLTQFIKAHFQIIEKHPGMFNFMRMVNKLVAKEALDELAELSRWHLERYERTIFARVNWGMFQEGYAKETIKNLTIWVGMSCVMELDKKMGIEKLVKETEKYFDILKKSLYKPEYI